MAHGSVGSVNTKIISDGLSDQIAIMSVAMALQETRLGTARLCEYNLILCIESATQKGLNTRTN